MATMYMVTLKVPQLRLQVTYFAVKDRALEDLDTIAKLVVSKGYGLIGTKKGISYYTNDERDKVIKLGFKEFNLLRNLEEDPAYHEILVHYILTVCI